MMVPTVEASREASRSVNRGPDGVTFRIPCCSWQLFNACEFIVIFRFPPQTSAYIAFWALLQSEASAVDLTSEPCQRAQMDQFCVFETSESEYSCNGTGPVAVKRAWE